MGTKADAPGWCFKVEPLFSHNDPDRKGMHVPGCGSTPPEEQEEEEEQGGGGYLVGTIWSFKSKSSCRGVDFVEQASNNNTTTTTTTTTNDNNDDDNKRSVISFSNIVCQMTTSCFAY